MFIFCSNMIPALIKSQSGDATGRSCVRKIRPDALVVREGRNASDFFEPVEGPTEIVMPLRFAAMLRLDL
jgi:hypothetical protein